jgi:RNA polymerase sigma-70 factor (ECF subfamily)
MSVRTEAFFAALAEDLRAEALAIADLDARLDGVVERARAAWPRLLDDDRAFVGHVARTRRGADELSAALADLQAPDLCLAWACARGDADAILEIERRSFGDLEHVWRRYPSIRRDLEDIKQTVRARLFVGEGDEPPKIVEYSAKGTLKSWMRVVFTNLLSNLARQGAREIPVDEALLEALPDRAEGVEVRHVKELYREDLRAAFVQAIEGLTSREKNVLRYCFAEGLAIEQVAAIYGVHRSTAGRWLSLARQSLVAALRADLIARLRISDHELESVLRVALSEVEITLAKYLRVRP